MLNGANLDGAAATHPVQAREVRADEEEAGRFGDGSKLYTSTSRTTVPAFTYSGADAINMRPVEGHQRGVAGGMPPKPIPALQHSERESMAMPPDIGDVDVSP
jgi:hypothetical protein